MARMLKVPLSIFVDSADELTIRFYGADGLVLPTGLQHKIEGILVRGELRRVPSPAAGRQIPIVGVRDLIAAEASGKYEKRTLQVAVHGNHPAAAATAAALRMAGFSVPAQPALYFDGLTVSVSRDGFHFSLADAAARFDCRASEAMVYLTAMLNKPGSTVALPDDAPEAYEKMAAEHGTQTVRCGRETDAAERYAAQTFSQSAVAEVVSLLCFLDARGIAPASLRAFLPEFATHSELLDCSCERGALMRRLAAERDACAEEGRNGVCFRFSGGVVRVQPSAARRALKIVAEGASEEIAKELAVDVRTRAERIGRENAD